MFKKNKEEYLKICTLSGTNETGGRNCNFIEYKDTIIVIDVGFGFPDQSLYGIDYVIPNFSYLVKNKEKIKAIILTHGHLDHIGAIPYIIKDLGFPPIYAGAFAPTLINERLEEYNLKSQTKFIRVDKYTKLNIGGINVEFLFNAHSIPDSFSVLFNTSQGKVLFSGDYKIEESKTDMGAIEKLQGKVDLALVDSTNVNKEGQERHEKEAYEALYTIISKHSGRVIVGAFASLVDRLISLVDIAKKTNRKLCITGRSMLKVLEMSASLKYVELPEGMLITETDLKKYPDNEILMLITGSQGERYAAMNRISLGEHKYIKVKQNDLFILSASEVPGNESQIEKMTDRLLKLGAELIKGNEGALHAGGHGRQEDMRIFYNLLKPRYIMPIHGSLTYRYKSKKLHVGWGHSQDKVLLTEDGQTWNMLHGEIRRGIKIESRPVLIDGLGVRDIGDVVLKDRQQLAEYGMFAIILNINSKSKQLISRPHFVSRGFIYMKTEQKFLNEIENIVKDIHRKWLSLKQNKYEELCDEISKSVKRYIYKKTEREPIIITTLI